MATNRRRGRRPTARRNGAAALVDSPRRGDRPVAPTTVLSDNADADFDGDLPEGWTTARVGELCHLVNGRAFKPRDWSDKGLPIIRIQNLNNVDAPFNHFPGDADSRHIVENGELLFAWSGTPGTSFGAHIWNRGRAVLNQHIFRVLFSERSLDKRFLRHAINQRLDDLIYAAHGGAGLAHVTKPIFEQTILALPPLAEQKRIVAKVEEVLAPVNAARDHLARVPTLLKRFRQSVLAAACSGRLTEDWRIQRRASDEWPSVELQELLAEPMANGHSVPTADKGFPVLRLTALKNGRIDLSERKTGAWSPAEARRYLVRRDDFLVSRGNGSLRLVGRGGLVDSDPDAVAYPDTLIRVRPKLDILSTAFLRIAWDSPEVRSQIEAAAHTTAGIHKVSQQDLGVITIPQPALPEQHEIVRRVDALFALADSIEQRVADATARANALTQATLAKAFRGELVPQGPAGER
jgi:type I restriction enzyme, S subunit